MSNRNNNNPNNRNNNLGFRVVRSSSLSFLRQEIVRNPPKKLLEPDFGLVATPNWFSALLSESVVRYGFCSAGSLTAVEPVEIKNANAEQELFLDAVRSRRRLTSSA